MNDYYKNLPRKRMASGALIFNGKHELLIVKPSYKDHWSLPGGVVEKDESPRAACIREIREEIGIDIKNAEFLCMDYVSADSEKDENLQFIFNCGVLDDKDVRNIAVDGKEIIEYKFVTLNEAEEIAGTFNEKLKKRFLACVHAIANKETVYMES